MIANMYMINNSKIQKLFNTSLPSNRTSSLSRTRHSNTCFATATPLDTKRQPRPENVQGDFYVDSTCIDCDTCRWMAPDIFDRVHMQSAVVKQPQSAERRKRAMQALISCPTYSIHMKQQHPGELQEERKEIPIPVEGVQGIYHAGYHSEQTFGGAAWLVLRQNGGAVMIDVPRFDRPLVKKIEDMGGISFIVVTHRDDIGEHDKWAKHFNAQRIIHETELEKSPYIDEAERLLQGPGPWYVDEDEDLQIIHVPGHTEGSIVLYNKSQKTIFTGDHLGLSGQTQQLTIFPRYNRFGKYMQLASVAKLLNLEVTQILPGHGRPLRFDSQEDYVKQINDLLETEGYAEG
eukprot:TRINITY_DN5624_c0_g1_i9.p1 TRINITY_DN5624_c0_g1~~TRINITY_DN5624_c0_g1_i9.p1  ORF type:complete len:347 (+),score=23.27 TRINITY_DN5624_c0_g1_i9:56-1096(+)